MSEPHLCTYVVLVSVCVSEFGVGEGCNDNKKFLVLNAYVYLHDRLFYTPIESEQLSPPT